MFFFGRFVQCRLVEHKMVVKIGLTLSVMTCIFTSHCTILFHSAEIITLQRWDLRRATSTKVSVTFLYLLWQLLAE